MNRNDKRSSKRSTTKRHLNTKTINKTKKKPYKKTQLVEIYPKLNSSSQIDERDGSSQKPQKSLSQTETITGTHLFVIDNPKMKVKKVTWTIPQEMEAIYSGCAHTIIVPKAQQHMCYVTGVNQLGQCGIGMNHKISHHAQHPIQNNKNGPLPLEPYITDAPPKIATLSLETEVAYPERLKWPSHSTLTHIAIGKDHTIWCVNHTNLYSTGWNTRGQCGVGTKYNVYIPTKIPLNEHKINHIACGDSHTIIVTQPNDDYSIGHKIFAMGSNRHGQLALDDPTYYTKPTLVDHPNLSEIEVDTIAASSNSTLILTNDGNLIGFGQNKYGELGLGHRVQVDAPQIIRAGISTDTTNVITQIAAGSQHAVYVLDDRRLFVAGSNAAHQLGLDKREHPYALRFVEFEHPLLKNRVIRKVVCGRFCTAVLTHDHCLFLFGARYGPFQESNFLSLSNMFIQDISIQNELVLLICRPGLG